MTKVNGKEQVTFTTETGEKIVIKTNANGNKVASVFSATGEEIADAKVKFKKNGTVLKLEMKEGRELTLTGDDIDEAFEMNSEGAKFKVKMSGWFAGLFKGRSEEKQSEVEFRDIDYAKKVKARGVDVDAKNTNVDTAIANGQGKDDIYLKVDEAKTKRMRRQKSHLQEKDYSKGTHVFEYNDGHHINDTNFDDEGSNAQAMKLLADVGITAVMLTQLVSSYKGVANIGDILTDEVLKSKFLHDVVDKANLNKGVVPQFAIAAAAEYVLVKSAHKTIESNYSVKTDKEFDEYKEKNKVPELEDNIEISTELKAKLADIKPMPPEQRRQALTEIQYKVGSWSDRDKMRDDLYGMLKGASRDDIMTFLQQPIPAACACDAYKFACEALYGYTPSGGQVWNAADMTMKKYNVPDNGKTGQAGPVRGIDMAVFEKVFKPKSK